ncbi:Uncharacterised protein [Mycobacteroides abscessus subsp. bolletii]|uniref:hypothetical protein n=1 Tax=Mycobacteroides abscessus TaxID=36809 RepID=UPI0009A74873|nr:hypothetical protein [Mycobacteroides abscessus]SKV05846.1 Uncharacterised protein [Mycobacteroides abscessus subsp. bolletii]
MSGEPIGEVELSSGVVYVWVNLDSGKTIMRIGDRNGRSDAGAMKPDEIAKVVELLERARRVAPSILAAHKVRQRAVMAAEATYERIVARAIGGAQ